MEIREVNLPIFLVYEYLIKENEDKLTEIGSEQINN